MRCGREGDGIPRPHTRSRFVPDTELERAADMKPTDDYEAWLQAKTAQCDTEINVQLGELTFKKHQLTVLAEPYYRFPDFIEVFGTGANANLMQCAEVQHKTEREWFRLAGVRHDLQRWTADKRRGRPYFSRPFPSALKSSEMWVHNALQPVMRFLKGLTVFMPDAPCADERVVMLCGILSDPLVEVEKDKDKEKEKVCHDNVLLLCVCMSHHSVVNSAPNENPEHSCAGPDTVSLPVWQLISARATTRFVKSLSLEMPASSHFVPL